MTDCLIDLATGDVIKNPYAPARTVTAKKVSDNKYTAILVPQMLVNKKPLLEIIFKDVSYMIESKFQFKTGIQHVLNVRGGAHFISSLFRGRVVVIPA